MVNSKNRIFLKGVNLAAFLMTVAVNALSNILPLNGKTTGEISDSYPNLFTPAGYVFSIWGVIYVLQLVLVVYLALNEPRKEPFLLRIGYLYALSSVANVLWLFLWHYEQIVLSLVPMFVLLATLIAIYIRLQVGRSDISLKGRLAVHLPFSVYLGWITVATIANMAAALTAVNWDGWGIGEVTWTILVIIIALIITIGVISTRRDVAFSLVIMWALGGIIVKQIENQSIVLTAGVGLVIIVVTLILRVILARSR